VGFDRLLLKTTAEDEPNILYRFYQLLVYVGIPALVVFLRTEMR